MAEGNGNKLANRAVIALTVVSICGIAAGMVVAAYNANVGAVIAVVSGAVGGIVAITIRVFDKESGK